MRASSPVHIPTAKCKTEINSNCKYTTGFVTTRYISATVRHSAVSQLDLLRGQQ